MQLVRFFHWNVAEAEERAERLRSAGYGVDHRPMSPETFKALRESPPDVVVIDLGPVPEKVTFLKRAAKGCDVIIWFTRSSRDLESRIKKLGVLAGKDGLWVVWPKKTSGVKTDLTQADVRRTGLACGLVDYKVCSVDATWTGLRFTVRKKK